MDAFDCRKNLIDKGLKVTPQRLAILEAVHILNNHPAAEQILEYIRSNHPNIASGTVYKVLDTLVETGLIRKVKTDRDIKRYDSMLEPHHHLYCAESDRIEDYRDEELNRLIEGYFQNRSIAGFQIHDIKLQIIGRFVQDALPKT